MKPKQYSLDLNPFSQEALPLIDRVLMQYDPINALRIRDYDSLKQGLVSGIEQKIFYPFHLPAVWTGGRAAGNQIQQIGQIRGFRTRFIHHHHLLCRLDFRTKSGEGRANSPNGFGVDPQHFHIGFVRLFGL